MNTLRDDVMDGLARNPKTLPAKLLYDQQGSVLFEKICGLKEYYQTRAELQILHDHAKEISEELGEHCCLVEFGSGSSTKTQVILDVLKKPVGYVPIDISKSMLSQAAALLAHQRPQLKIYPVYADFMDQTSFAHNVHDIFKSTHAEHCAAFFPGSTIGNLEPGEVEVFLSETAQLLGPHGKFILGVDLVKERSVLEAAYNDSQGVTAEFNLNVLKRINRELGADFNLDEFLHLSFYNPTYSRIEMHLVSRTAQVVHIDNQEFYFEPLETIHTENSYKYTIEMIKHIAHYAGFHVSQLFTDDRQYFGVFILESESGSKYLERPAA